MKSPFPGMDPYLERHWLDVHARLVTYAADQLNERLPRSLVARTEERIGIDSDEFADILGTAPDVRVFEPGISDEPTSGIAYHAPIKLVVDVDPIKEHFIQIISVADERLITVIEIVSPTNKLGSGLEQFRTKRAQLIQAGVHMVEVDLVRRGNWRALLKPHHCPKSMLAEYRVTVRLASDRQTAYLYPAALRLPLPTILMPLRQGDAEVKMELQPLVEQVYTRGRYSETIDYRKPLEPPLNLEDAAWAEELIKQTGKAGR
jgi:hypothetical protein